MRFVTLASTVVSLALLSLMRDGISGYPKWSPASTASISNNALADKGTLVEKLEANGLNLGAPVFIRIFKQSRELGVWIENDGGTFDLFETYPICAFSGGLGPKLKEGDLQAPEGFYFVTQDALLPTSRYHRAFNLGYPNAYDRAHGRTGSFLMVHGSCVSVGCYAMTDRGIEEIYMLAENALASGQPFFRVHIFPFRMTEENLNAHAALSWNAYWVNLKEGYDHFERTGRPPHVSVRDGMYVFSPS